MIVAVMFDNLGAIEVVETTAPEFAAGERKPGGVDDVDRDPQTRPQPEQGAGVAGDIGLVKDEIDSHPSLHATRAETLVWV
jgi:hypothetical protein